MQQNVKFENLKNSDLIVDCVYLGGSDLKKVAGNDPVSKLLGCGNAGGFRYRGSSKKGKIKYIALLSSLAEPDWPDYIDEVSGRLIYFGDNRNPGSLLHDTSRQGNEILRQIFENLYNGKRNLIPPIFIFTKIGAWRDYEFRGLAVPGAKGISQTEDLIAIWKSKEGKRFQNYKAVFTILDTALVPRKWISDLEMGKIASKNCPIAFSDWLTKGVYTPLMAQRTVQERVKNEQIPSGKEEQNMIKAIYEYFRKTPHKFEKCAAELIVLMDKNVVSYDLTRPSRDGGRDAIGKYKIGIEANSINVDFALEAKLHKIDISAGVKETSRLISRVRPRQFGIFVTTSFVASQAYKEIIEDGHPIILVCANDIVSILKRSGYTTREGVENWLQTNFPIE